MSVPDERVFDAYLADLVPRPRASSAVLSTTSTTSFPGYRPDEQMVVSVVVPTRNEAANIEPLLRRLDAALAGLPSEVIFVDDSDDDTPEIAMGLRRSVRMRIRVHHRPAPYRTGGLGGAVTEGIRLCRADYAVVLDGDLQHPPEVVPELLAAAVSGDVDVVVGSRYVTGGSASGLANGARRLVSSSANLLSRLVFPLRLRGVSDVMSGFFLVRVAALDLDRLRPDGYKILLELLVRTGRLRVVEVGYVFGERHAGESNASVSEGVRFARRLFSLRVPRAARFALVGASGTLPNIAGTALLHHVGMHYIAAAVLATQLAILWNFIGCDLLVWERGNQSRARRYLPFAVLNNLDLVIRLPLLGLFVDRWHTSVPVATFVTLAVAVSVRYVLVDRMIYSERQRPARRHSRYGRGAVASAMGAGAAGSGAMGEAEA
ncbi:MULTISPECIES: glycosyltransferase family 2 protein [Protofrankia]|uniref:Glycosyl transferase n=1 Tax=Protofrankia coriariae TaxID=1562887 RepID=A0ABR5F6K7_9ACTN|nr:MULTISPECIES: glycosyltransferase family 2 protein [Protofrankia]KLL12290.1 glycosyl transferase [Protofrankia coriariae]ONH37769.1 glycosyl transferase [Protofrankia sp. BMG5.30]